MADPQQAGGTGFDKWREGLDRAVGDARWNAYDCDIQPLVADYNRHLARSPGYLALDWRLIKAMAWVESGAAHAQWHVKPLQIGVPGDPGLAAFLSGDEGGGLILPLSWKGRLTSASARSQPLHNLCAGTGYLLMRLARFDHRSLPVAGAPVREVTVQRGDSLARIARAQGSTVEMLRELNPAAGALQPGQVLKVRAASVRQLITGWRAATTQMVAQRYNGGGDPNYARKLDHALALVHRGREALCAA